jgi:hypothetical protein
LPAEGFLVEDVFDLSHGRGAEDRGASFRRSRRRSRPLVLVHRVWARAVCGKSRVSGCGISASRLGSRCKQARYATPSWAPAKEAPPRFVAVENAPQEYGPWQWAKPFGAATGLLASRSLFRGRENGMLRCPAGASLWLSEVRQETALTQRAVYVASPSGLSAL